MATRVPTLLERGGAEALGTFILVFVGSGTAAVANLLFLQPRFATLQGNLLLVALGLGLALFIGIMAFGKISGGHFNPAVTLGLASIGHFAWADVPAYLIGQVVGAIVGALGIALIYGKAFAKLTGLGAPTLGLSIGNGQGLIIEALGTAILMLAIMGTAADSRSPIGWAGLTIGLTLAAVILFIGTATGGSVNPARALGPDVVATFFGYQVNWGTYIVTYLIGPIIGAILAAFVYVGIAALPRPAAVAAVGGPRPRVAEAPGSQAAADLDEETEVEETEVEETEVEETDEEDFTEEEPEELTEEEPEETDKPERGR
jgi:glycerol uptake facilitator protein